LSISLPPKRTSTNNVTPNQRSQEGKARKNLNDIIAKLKWNIGKHTQRFNKQRQTRNKVRNKGSTQNILPKDRC